MVALKIQGPLPLALRTLHARSFETDTHGVRKRSSAKEGQGNSLIKAQKCPAFVDAERRLDVEPLDQLWEALTNRRIHGRKGQSK